MRKRADFVRLSSDGCKTASRSFVLLSLPNQLGHPRVGITVTRRVGGAVVRNRIKRHVREYVRRILDSLPPRDYVVIARVSASRANSDSISSDLDRLFCRKSVC